uniref:Choline transporter-like protein n=1 Tax=Megaselia scalaris TaxID=36166 RepID=T1GVJ2_MEGSC
MEWVKTASSNANNSFLGPCPSFPIYESSSIFHRCIPTTQQIPNIGNNVYTFTQQFLSDIYNTWPLILGMSLLAFILSLVLVGLMHYLSTIISWLICVLSVLVKYSFFEEYIRNDTALYILAIVATIIMVILIIAVYLLKNKLAGLTALFEESGKCMLSLPGLTIPPLIAFGALLIFLVFWIIVVICIISSTYPSAPNETTMNSLNNSINIKQTSDSTKPFHIEYIDATWIKNMLWIYFVGLIWTSEFIFACQQFTLAGAVAFWYFKKKTDSPTIYAMGKLMKYHLGSVAKGSFVITIFKIPRLILTYLYTKLKKNEESECASCCLKCCICGFWMLEKFIRFLNHNAYTVIAIESINFCPAAGIAWNAMATNAAQVAVVNTIGDFILFLGKYIFLCVCEDKTINGNAGRWKQSNLAKLLGEEPMDVDSVEGPIQVVEMMPINQQPFKS